MKKNLRIVSATAAALLAVAPVAATSVAPVFAVSAATTEVPEHTNITVSVRLINPQGVMAGQDTKQLHSEIITDQGSVVSDAGTKFNVYTTQNWDAHQANNATALVPVTHFAPGTDYVVVADATRISVGKRNANYDLTYKDGLSTADATRHENVNSFDKGEVNLQNIVSNVFRVGTDFVNGTPGAIDAATGKYAPTGQIGLGQGKYSVTAIEQEIRNHYHVTSDIDNDIQANRIEWNNAAPTFRKDITDALKANSITLNSDDETFAKPVAPFNITVHLKATTHNGNDGTFIVTVNPEDSNLDLYPHISFEVKDRNNADGFTRLSYAGKDNNVVGAIRGVFDNVDLNSTLDKRVIAHAFTIRSSSNDNSALLDPVVDISKVNTKVAGRYPITVSATNAAGNTSSVVFYITVGDGQGTYTTIQADTDTVPVYQIDGNNVVTLTNTTVKNGDPVVTYGTVKIGDKSYTRINSATSDKFVETKYVDGSIKPAPTVAKKVMHNAYIYDANHKRVGSNTLAAYTTVNVYGNATKLADGSLVYKIGDNQYVMADNIDGTSRTLTHNAYVYKTSKKRADRRVLRKGSTVTTYGAPYKFKNGKSYYRIGGPAKQYVKVANF